MNESYCSVLVGLYSRVALFYLILSYSSNGIGKHYAKYHPTHKQCQLTFKFIDKQSNSARRKISEAIKIHKDKPNLIIKRNWSTL